LENRYQNQTVVLNKDATVFWYMTV